MTEVDERCRWSTPADIFNPLAEEFGITLDACAEPWNTKCQEFISPDQDGMVTPWRGTAWMNPPYGREIESWVKKAYEESLRGVTVVCLVPARTETAWWHEYCLKGEIRFIRGRIHFTDPRGKSGRPRFGSAIVIFRASVICPACDGKKTLLRPLSGWLNFKEIECPKCGGKGRVEVKQIYS